LCFLFKKKRPFQQVCGDEEEAHIRKKMKIQKSVELYERENVGLKDANKKLQSRITLLKYNDCSKNLVVSYCFFSSKCVVNSGEDFFYSTPLNICTH
jgi:cell division protein FtsB